MATSATNLQRFPFEEGSASYRPGLSALPYRLLLSAVSNASVTLLNVNDKESIEATRQAEAR